MMHSENSVSRRDFIKLAAVLLASSAIPPSIADYLEESGSKYVVPEGDPRAYTFEGEAREAINEINYLYGIQIFCLKEWNGKRNLIWPTEAVTGLKGAMGLLPREYYDHNKTKYIFLVRVPNTNGSVGGSFAGDAGTLYLPGEFEIDGRLAGWEGEVYRVPIVRLYSVIAHELTHSFTDNNKDILDLWTGMMGWKQRDDGSWYSDCPEGFSEELINNYSTYGWPRLGPNEDMAISASRIAIGRGDTLSPDRLKFFLETPPYSKWDRVLKISESGL